MLKKEADDILKKDRLSGIMEVGTKPDKKDETGEKAKMLLNHPEMYADQPKEIQDEIKKLSMDYLDEKKEQPITPIPARPRIKIKEKPENKALDLKGQTRITEDQLNILTYTVAQGVCMGLNKEDMTPEETATFSKTLYEIGMMNGWFDKVEFLPYLILIGAGFDLTMKIWKKPSKTKPITKTESVIEQINSVPTSILKNADIGKVDIIDEDKLTAKLGGSRIYKTEVISNE